MIREDMNTLNFLISNGMVLQANMPIRIFGEGDGKVEVSFLGKTYFAESGNGEWCVELLPQPYGGPYTMDVVLNNTVQTIEDVMIGEVVLLAGQSNAEWPVKSEKTTKSYPDENANIRFAIAGGYNEEKRFLTGMQGWQKKTKESIGRCSAIGRHLAEMIHEKLGVAVGIICCYKGASIIQAWTDKEVVQKSKYYIPKKDRHLNYEAYGDFNQDGFLYENIFKKIGCYSLSQVVWYQGESNTGEKEGAVYLHLLEEMINDWRKQLRQENLPFTVVEIHNYFYREDEGWYSIQRAQKQANTIPFVRVVENEDCEEPKEIHPSDKYKISKRIFETMQY